MAAHAVLILNNPLLRDFTVEIYDTSMTAIGKIYVSSCLIYIAVYMATSVIRS